MKPSPMNRAPGVLLALAIGLALAAWVCEWASDPCYLAADKVVCK